MKNLLFFIFILCSCGSSNSHNLDDSWLLGTWSPSDSEARGGNIEIYSNDSVVIEVNSNQIYILGGIRKKAVNSYFVFLKNPYDLGVGGLHLEWNDFSTDTSIACIEYLNDSAFNFIWYGFYNTKKQKYFWMNEPDWYREHGYKSRVVMKKCL